MWCDVFEMLCCRSRYRSLAAALPCTHRDEHRVKMYIFGKFESPPRHSKHLDRRPDCTTHDQSVAVRNPTVTETESYDWKAQLIRKIRDPGTHNTNIEINRDSCVVRDILGGLIVFATKENKNDKQNKKNRVTTRKENCFSIVTIAR